MLNSKLLSRPTAQPALPADCAVVLADLSQDVIDTAIANSLLSQDEARRAAKYRSAERAQLYVHCRALLRLLLAESTGIPAGEITFDEGPFGKPVLSDAAAKSGIHFNISHTGSMALVAITSYGEVGVDIERCETGRNITGIAENFFTVCEQQAIQAIDETAREAAFYSCWCRKESLAKATGLGLQLPLNKFAVNVAPEAPAKLLSMDYEPLKTGQWQMHTLHMPDGYFGALTIQRAIA